MNRTIKRVAAAATLAVAALAVGAGTASAATVVVPGQKGDCVFVGGFTVGNPLQPGPLFKSDPKTGVYVSNNCPA